MKSIRAHNTSIAILASLWCFAVPLPGVESGSQTDSGYNFLLINEAQTDSLSVIVPNSAANILLTGSEDGSLNVYRDGSVLIQHIQVSANPIVKLAFDGDSRVAVLEHKPDKKYRLSLWNWKLASEIWFADLDEQVLSVAFSPRSNFVVCTLARWNSLLFIESSTGVVKSWLQQGFGIVDYTLMSSKEERIMSYNATSGFLSYHDLQSGEEIRRFATKTKLKQFQVVLDNTRARACAIDGKNVVSIDLLTGKILSTKDPGFSPAFLLIDDSVSGRLVAWGGPSNTAKYQGYFLDPSNGNLVASGAAEKITVKSGIISAGLLNGQLILGDSEGFLHKALGKDIQQVLTDRDLSRIVGVGFSDQSIYLSTTAGFIRFSTSLLDKASGFQTLTEAPKTKFLSAVSPGAGVLNINEKELLLWERTSTPRLLRFDTAVDAIRSSSSAMPLSFLKVKISNRQAISVDAGGQIRLWSTAEIAPIFSRNILGALGAEVLSNSEIVVTKGSSGKSDSPIMRIVPRTGETIPVPNPDDAIFASGNRSSDGLLYFLSVSRQAGVSSTKFQRLNTKAWNQEPELIRNFVGENFGADLLVSEASNLIFTSADRNLITVWDGQNATNMEQSTRFPRQLSTNGRLLCGINQDGSVSVWDTESKKCLLDIFVLKSGLCFFLTRSGAYGIAQPLGGYKMPADALRDRAQVERKLRPSFASYQGGTLGIREVSYPLSLP